MLGAIGTAIVVLLGLIVIVILILALILVPILVVGGVAYAIAPDAVDEYMKRMEQKITNKLRGE